MQPDQAFQPCHLALVAAEFAADDLREDCAADMDFRWLSVIHMMFSDLPDLPVVDYETVEQYGVTSALALRLGEGGHWIRLDAWNICGSLTISDGYRQSPS